MSKESRRRANAVNPAVSAIETAVEIIDPSAAGAAFIAGGAISGPLQSAMRAGGDPDAEPRNEARAERKERRAAKRAKRHDRDE
jgi:hypothetical protein